MVEDGIAEMDDILKERIAVLKLDRERNKAALDRIKANVAPAAGIASDMIERFGRAIRENITTGEIPFRKAYLKSIITGSKSMTTSSVSSETRPCWSRL